MKKINALVALSLMSGVAVASVEDVTLTSPRTGISYTLSVPVGQKVELKVAEIVAANSETSYRIVAKNPALSTESQEQARQKLVEHRLVQAQHR